MHEEIKKSPAAKKHRFLFAAVYSLVLIAFTAYVMLDTFVLETVEQKDATAQNTSMFDGIEVKKLSVDNTASADSDANSSSSRETSPSQSTDETENTSRRSRSRRGSDMTADNNTDTASQNNAQQPSSSQSTGVIGSYGDENISVTITEYYENNTAIYVADVYLSSAQYLKTAFANGSYGKNVKAATSEIAEDNSAVFAVNGDYYGARERGYVIRNGIVYRDTASSGDEILCIYADGHLDVISPDEASADELIEAGVWQAFDFGPGLLENGSLTVSERDEVDQAMASNPRTAIGQIDDLHYVFVVSDGRTSESAGLSLYQLAQFMQSLGCETAYNLDGGGSSTMYFDGEVVNNPTTNGKNSSERRVSDIVYLGY